MLKRKDPTKGRRGRGRRAAFRAAAVAGLAVAVFLASEASPSVSEGIRSLFWPSTDGVLLEASRWRQYQPGEDMDSGYHESWLRLDYAFSLPGPDGRAAHYRGERFDVTTSGDSRKHRRSFVSSGMAREAMRDAPSVQVHYDPADPTRCVLRPGIAYGTTTLLMIITTLLGCTVILWRASAPPSAQRAVTERGKAEKNERTKRSQLGPVGALVIWLFLIPFGWLIFAGGLGVAWDRVLGGTPPTAFVLLYLAAPLVAVTWPRTMQTKLVGGTLTALMVAIPVVGLIAAGYLFVEDMRGDPGRLAYEPTDRALIEQLESPHPGVRAATAERIADRRGPIEAGPRLLDRLARETDDRARRAVERAISRLGLEPRAE